MLALAGYPLGLRFRLFDSTPNACAGDCAQLVVGDYNDTAALDAFAAGLDVVTYEFENVPVASARHLSGRLPVYPPPQALETAQDRLNEKTMFRNLGIETPPFEAIDSREQLESALKKIGFPAVLKTRRLGYDGKGQFVIKDESQTAAAWQALGSAPLILERFVPFQRELSILSVRGRGGEVKFYPLVENHHRGGILRLSRAPAPGLTQELQVRAEKLAEAVLKHLDFVGVLAIELFELNGRLLANEIAPRVHNSGHWTIEGAQGSQFENHLRAGLGWPLGSTAARGQCAMLNLIGTLPEREALLSISGAHLHLYGKSPAPGRKLGHVTLVEPDQTTLEQRLEAARRFCEEK
jgi:5-(carboxyamino)imidazole ribonucleotide synthase